MLTSCIFITNAPITFGSTGQRWTAMGQNLGFMARKQLSLWAMGVKYRVKFMSWFSGIFFLDKGRPSAQAMRFYTATIGTTAILYQPSLNTAFLC